MSFASDLFTKTTEFAHNAMDTASQLGRTALGTAALVIAPAIGAVAQQAPGGYAPDPMSLKPRTVKPITPVHSAPSADRSLGLHKYTVQSSATVVAPAAVAQEAPHKAEKYKPVRPHVAKNRDRSKNFDGLWISSFGLSYIPEDKSPSFTFGATVPLYKDGLFAVKGTVDSRLTGKGIGYAASANTPFGSYYSSAYTRFNSASLGAVVGVESNGGGDVGGYAGASAKVTCYPGGANNLLDYGHFSAGAKAVGYWGKSLSSSSKIGVTASLEVDPLRVVNKNFVTQYFGGLATKDQIQPLAELKVEAAFLWGDFRDAREKRQEQKLRQAQGLNHN